MCRPDASITTWLLSPQGDSRRPTASRFDKPNNVNVYVAYLVHSGHLYIGCKTFGCSVKLHPDEPNLCKQHQVEPHAYHIANRSFVEIYFVQAYIRTYASRDNVHTLLTSLRTALDLNFTHRTRLATLYSYTLLDNGV